VIRLTWLQSRTQNIVAMAGLGILAAVAAVTGPHLVHLYDTTVATCKTHRDCDTAIPAFLGHDDTLRTLLGGLVRAVPAVVGIFWGAPLVAREFESKTYRLVWTQSVTRTRWLAIKLGVIGLASIALAGLLSLIVSWWASPLDRAQMNRFTTFDQRDLVPVAYAALAFVFGVTAGLLLRRTLPAMAFALVAFAGARLAIAQWVRPHLFAAAHTTLPVSAAPHSHLGLGRSATYQTVGNPRIPNAWVISSRMVDKTGHAATPQAVHTFIQTACPLPAQPSRAAGSHCFARINAHFHLAVTYQPAGRYWPLQWSEAAIFLAISLILAGFCFWWIGDRRYS
jgi:hypothetical protein